MDKIHAIKVAAWLVFYAGYAFAWYAVGYNRAEFNTSKEIKYSEQKPEVNAGVEVDPIYAAAIKPQPKDLRVGQLWVLYIRDPWNPIIVTNEIVELKNGMARYRQHGEDGLKTKADSLFRACSCCIHDPAH